MNGIHQEAQKGEREKMSFKNYNGVYLSLLQEWIDSSKQIPVKIEENSLHII